MFKFLSANPDKHARPPNDDPARSKNPVASHEGIDEDETPPPTK